MYSNTATLSKRPSSKLPVASVSNGSRLMEKTKTDLAVNQFCRIQTSKSRRFEPRLGFLTRFDQFAKVPRVFTQSRSTCDPRRLSSFSQADCPGDQSVAERPTKVVQGDGNAFAKAVVCALPLKHFGLFITPYSRDARAAPSFRDYAVRLFYERDKDRWITEFRAPLVEIAVGHFMGAGAGTTRKNLNLLRHNFLQRFLERRPADRDHGFSQ